MMSGHALKLKAALSRRPTGVDELIAMGMGRELLESLEVALPTRVLRLSA